MLPSIAATRLLGPSFRSLKIVVLVFTMILLAGCGDHILTPSPIVNVGSTIPTLVNATPDANATGLAAAAATATALSADATHQDEQQFASTTTAIPAAVQTPLAILGFSDTAEFGGWTFSLARLEAYRSVITASGGSSLSAKGYWWLIWLDARNTQDSERPLTWDLAFQLQSSDGTLVDHLDAVDRPAATALATHEGRDPFTTSVAPTSVAHTLLAFDLPAGVVPAALIARHAVDPATRVSYDLNSAIRPALERAAAADSQATAVAAASATELAVNAAATAQAEHAATTAVAARTATAEVAAANKHATAVAQAAANATAAAAVPRAEITYINYDGREYRTEGDEYAEITNTGGAPLNLKGYLLNAGDPGQDFYFPARVLQPGESLRVFTNAYGDPGDYSFDIGRAIWNNDGDCGYLYNARGQQVDSYCY